MRSICPVALARSAALRASSLLLLSLGLLGGCALEPEPSAATAELVDVEAELRTHFHDAALYCDYRLLAGLTVSNASSLGDAALVGYAGTVRRSGVSELLTGPHAGPGPERDTVFTSNPCYWGASVEGGQLPDTGLEDGFCRADFNYCIGQELVLHARSLADGSEHSELKAELLRRARERLQASGLEYASSLAFFERICSEDPESFPFECGTRLALSGPSFLPIAHARLLESVSQVLALSQEEAGLRVDLGDRRHRSTAPPSPTQTTAGLFGEFGSRTAGVSVFYGPPDDVVFETRANFRRWQPVVVPFLAPANEHTVAVLELMRRYRVPSAFYQESPDGPIGVLTGISEAAHYQLLDHRLAAERYSPPYDVIEPADPSTDLGTILRSRRALTESELAAVTAHTFAPHESVLEGEYGLGVGDIARAMVLLADVYETGYGRITTEPQVWLDSGPALLAVTAASPAMRPPQMLAAAFSDEPGSTSADPLLPMLAPMLRDATAAPSGEWYAWDLSRVDGSIDAGVGPDVRASLGAAGALHVLRVHLLRMRVNAGAFIDEASTAQALDLIEHAIGPIWTEYDDAPNLECDCGSQPFCFGRSVQPFYGPCQNCLCDLQPPATAGPRWDIYAPPGALDAGGPVAVYWVDDARCLEHGRRPGSEEPCSLVPVELPLAVARVSTSIGREWSSYSLPAPPAEATHHYILWRAEDSTDYRLIDVVPVHRAVGVHPLGGIFLDGAASAWSRDPWRPGTPSISASGAVRALVPPLESELTSDSDAYEDSFELYLSDAENAVTLASAQLAQLRADELLARQDGRSTDARLSEAVLVETAALADLCGDLPACRLERVPTQTLQELGIAAAPPSPPDLTGSDYADCDAVRVGQFRDFTDRIALGFDNDDEARGFVSSHMLRVLACSTHRYLSTLAELEVSGLPVAVRDELDAHGGGEFPTYSGQVRERLIALFHALDGVRRDLRALATHRFAAEAHIASAAMQISHDNLDEQERLFCELETGLSIASEIASIISSALGASSSFQSAATGSSASSSTNAANSSGGSGGMYRGSAQDVGRGMNQAASGTASEGRVVQHVARFLDCGSQDAAELSGQRQAAQLIGSMQTLVSLARSADQGTRGAHFTVSSLDSLERQALFAGRRREVSRMLAESDSLADLPEWHALRGFRARRAETALLRAQQAVFVARRAIEYRFGIDLSSMNEPEPLTPPPATWADSLFDIGGLTLSVPETDDEDEAYVSIAAEELGLYVSRLRRFVRGYPIARRFRDADDLQVLDVGAMLRAPADAAVTEQMLFKCSDHPVPLLAGSLPRATPDAPWPTGAPCEGLGDVEYAEVRFSIPAGLDDYLSDRLAAGSFNYRHSHFAPNLVGTGIVDCSLALDRSECYRDGNIPYSIRHQGPVAVESFDRTTEVFFVEPGVVRDGRALVAERSLTTPLSHADRTLVSPYLRTELRGRPLSGLYALRIDGRPEINWSRLERMQLLVGYRYWTRQE